MMRRRPILIPGLRLVFSRPGALLWTYALNFLLALLFSLPLHARLADLMDHSLAAQRLSSGFDLGTLIPAMQRLSTHSAPSGTFQYASIPLYVLMLFVLVPGTLLSYVTGARASLVVLAGGGIAFFWRFVRIALLTVLVSGAILVPLALAQGVWARFVTANHTGLEVYWLQLPGLVLIALVACLLRLYFDLVEVGTVQLGQTRLASGKPDRRVRRTLLPALRLLRENFARAYGCFVLLAAAGLVVMLFLSRVAVHMLAQPRVWPMLFMAQMGLFILLFTRFWQRGAETILAQVPSISSVLVPGYVAEADSEYGRLQVEPARQPIAPHAAQPGPAPDEHAGISPRDADIG